MSVLTEIFLSSSLSTGGSFLPPKPSTLDQRVLVSLRMRMQVERTSSNFQSFWQQTHWFWRIARYSITSSFYSSSFKHFPYASRAYLTLACLTRDAADSLSCFTPSFVCFFFKIANNSFISLSYELTVSPFLTSSSAQAICPNSSCALAFLQCSFSRSRVDSLSSLFEEARLNLVSFLMAYEAVPMACSYFLVLFRQRTLLESAYSLWSIRTARSYCPNAPVISFTRTHQSPLTLWPSDCSLAQICARHDCISLFISALTYNQLISLKSPREAVSSPFHARHIAFLALILAKVTRECSFSYSLLGSYAWSNTRHWSQSLMASCSLKSFRCARLRFRKALVSFPSSLMAQVYAYTAAVQFLSLKKESPLSFSQRGFLDQRSPADVLPLLLLGMGGSLICGKVSLAARLGQGLWVKATFWLLPLLTGISSSISSSSPAATFCLSQSSLLMSSSENMVSLGCALSRWYWLVTYWMILLQVFCLSCWEQPCFSFSSSRASIYRASLSLAFHFSYSRSTYSCFCWGLSMRPVCSLMPVNTSLMACSFSACFLPYSFSRSSCSNRIISCVALRSYSVRSLSFTSSACLPLCSYRSSLSLLLVLSSAKEMSSRRRVGHCSSVTFLRVAWRSPLVSTNLLSGERYSTSLRRSRKWVCFFSVEVTLRMRSERKMSTFLREVWEGRGIWRQRYLGSWFHSQCLRAFTFIMSAMMDYYYKGIQISLNLVWNWLYVRKKILAGRSNGLYILGVHQRTTTVDIVTVQSIRLISSAINPFSHALAVVSLYNPLPLIYPLWVNCIILIYKILFQPMAQGKSKKNYGKKGQKKKVVDSLSRKEWFELKAPAPFQSESFGFTCANRTQGLKKVEDSIKGRVVEQMQADLAPNQDSFHWRKIKLIVDQTEGRQAITSFYGVDVTRDELSSLIKKRKTLIEAIQDVKSQDGYVLRVFVIAFTRESANQKRKTNYALSSQQKIIRKRINDIVAKEVAKSNATQILNLFTSEVIEKKITKEVSPIYPVKNVKVRKIKVIQRPNLDFNKLSEMHDPEKRILTKATAKVQGRRGKPTREQNVEAENLVNKA